MMICGSSFLCSFESEDENIKEKQLDHFLDKKSDENDLSAEGEYKDSRFGKYVLFRVQRNFLIKDMIQIWKMKILKQLKSH